MLTAVQIFAYCAGEPNIAQRICQHGTPNYIPLSEVQITTRNTKHFCCLLNSFVDSILNIWIGTSIRSSSFFRSTFRIFKCCEFFSNKIPWIAKQVSFQSLKYSEFTGCPKKLLTIVILKSSYCAISHSWKWINWCCYFSPSLHFTHLHIAQCTLHPVLLITQSIFHPVHISPSYISPSSHFTQFYLSPSSFFTQSIFTQSIFHQVYISLNVHQV